MPIETGFDAVFAASHALREKQIQQNYRPVIGVHKWFARRPGTLFRNLLLAEFYTGGDLRNAFYRAHHFEGVIGDPFMGGGTPLIEANRLGFNVVGADINPMAYWIVRQELDPLDDSAFATAASEVVEAVEQRLQRFYQTDCVQCGNVAPVKYFIWVKTALCNVCGTINPLFPGYLLAEKGRHPRHVIGCRHCFGLMEVDELPRQDSPITCPHCSEPTCVEGVARKGLSQCRGCAAPIRYPTGEGRPPTHMLWAIEYHCAPCKQKHTGRFFKAASALDEDRYSAAMQSLLDTEGLRIPDDPVPAGDETNRLHRWGYSRWRDLFNARQLLGLALLQQEIGRIEAHEVRNALITVFSDTIRYQNMLCRYDTYALKCQDIFAIHGFPVGLMQCENSLLGIVGVGAGGYRHFIEKYRRAKAYCRQPFETVQRGRSKDTVPILGECIAAEFVAEFPKKKPRQAFLQCSPAAQVELPPDSLDGVFTDPPYFDNVQYAELMDFCYVWLRQSLERESEYFLQATTRSADELTGNVTQGRDLEHFTAGLSRVFSRFGSALKAGAPFVFTYHHNDPEAYAPLVVAILDAGLQCTAVLPAPAEMGASLHINNTGSSVLDLVFVCRLATDKVAALPSADDLLAQLRLDCENMRAGNVNVTMGDVRCLVSGHIAQLCINHLREQWPAGVQTSIAQRLQHARRELSELSRRYAAPGLAA